MTDSRSGPEQLKTFLSHHPSIKHIRVNFTAYDNYQYSKGISVRRALELDGGGITTPGPITYGQTRYTQLLREAIEKQETNHWIPDWSTVRVSAGNATVADVTSWVTSPNCEREDGDTMVSCPRTILKRIQERAKDEHQMEIKVGWEIEFLLLASQDATTLVHTPRASFSTHGMSHPTFKVVYDAVEHLEANGVKVWTYHAESGADYGGGFEITLSPASPFNAADNLVFSMTVIREVAQKHGYFATLHPKPFEGGPGTGQHVHMSISRPELADQFLAGALARLPQTTAFLLGGYDSYSRKGAYGGGLVYHSTDKIPPVRDCGEAHWEFRIPDALTCPHLQLAALVATGLEGIEKQLDLPAARSAGAMMGMTGEEAKTQGIESIPNSLSEAVAALEGNSDWWKAKLGATCIQGYIANSRAEISQSEKMSYAQRTIMALHHV